MAWIKKARALFPKSAKLQSTQGSILIESGAIHEGMALLLPLAGPGKALSLRAMSAAYLAKGCHTLEKHDEAAKWLAMAKEIGGLDTVCARIEQEMSGNCRR